MNMEDFEEEEVWDIAVKESSSPHEQDSSHPKMKKLMISSSSSSAPRNIPRRAHSQTTTNQVLAKVAHSQQSSAPMNIPDWSKIYGKRNGQYYDHDDHHVDYHDHDNDVDDDDDDEKVPPHEWIARKLARSQISSFSVCEGIGRTLKGRDLSKVRNAILTKTGFLE